MSPSRLALARKVIGIFKQTPGVVDTDWYIEADQSEARFVIDKEKPLLLSGISAETISETLRIAGWASAIDLLHVPREKEDVDIVLNLPRETAALEGLLVACGLSTNASPLARWRTGARWRNAR